MSRPKPTLLARIVALAASLVIIAGGLEIYVRVFADTGLDFSLEMWKYSKEIKRISDDPRVGHEHRENAQAFLMGADVTTNQWGDRNPPVAVPKPPGIFRIVMLGDSLAFGWGVENKDTVSRLLETHLNARFPGRGIEVVNTGVGNYNTAMEVASLMRRSRKFEPDLIVLNYFINDTEPTPGYELPSLARYSYAAVFFGGLFDSALRSTNLDADWRSYYRGLYEPKNAAGMDAAARAIGELAEFGRTAGIPIIVANYPELRVLKPYPFPEATAWIKSQAEKNALPFVDLYDAVADSPPERLWVTRPDPHPNANANRPFAEALDRYLAQTVLDRRFR